MASSQPDIASQQLARLSVDNTVKRLFFFFVVKLELTNYLFILGKIELRNYISCFTTFGVKLDSF